MDLHANVPVNSVYTAAANTGGGGGGGGGGDAQEIGERQEEEEKEDFQVLSQDQIDEYVREGVLVVPNILSQEELRLALEGMQSSLQQRLITSKKKDAGTSDQVDLDEVLLDPSSSSSSSSNYKVDLDVLRKFRDELSSTNGSGGVLDIFWDDWKLRFVAHNPKLWQATKQLWKAAYHNDSDSGGGSIVDENDWRYHPYNKNETIDFDKGYCYIDRVGYRLPTLISEEWGDMLYEHDQRKQKHQHENGQEANENGIPSSKKKSKKKKKFRSVQRSLTPHLDCCPDNLWGRTDAKGESETTNNNNNAARPPPKWRPIQCFVALTDTLNKNEGGFECVPGFHHEFHGWAKDRQIHGGESTPSSSPSSLCVGEYSHIRPTEERHIMDRVQHIPITAGSAVFWDVRIPHANSYRNTTNRARQVVYCSFLPDIELNRSYVKNQLLSYQQNQPIRDQWNHISTTTTTTTATRTATTNHSVCRNDKNENHNDDIDGVDTNSANNNQNGREHGNDCSNKAPAAAFTDLGQKLMGMKPW